VIVVPVTLITVGVKRTLTCGTVTLSDLCHISETRRYSPRSTIVPIHAAELHVYVVQGKSRYSFIMSV